MMDAVSGIFLGALGADIPPWKNTSPLSKAPFSVLQYTAFGRFCSPHYRMAAIPQFRRPDFESENPWQLVARSALFAVLVAYAKPIFEICLSIARAPYLALMDSGQTLPLPLPGLKAR